MRRVTRLWPALPLIAVFASACGESYEDVYRDQLALQRELVGALEQVAAGADAAQAEARLRALNERIAALATRRDALGSIDATTRERVGAAHAEEVDTLARRFMQAMQKIAGQPELQGLMQSAGRAFELGKQG